MTAGQQRVHAIVVQHETPVTAKQVAAELGISTNWACHCLAGLVAAGAIDVRNADGGTYEWSRR
jgi:predicted ArsR family transcriptional regulator